MWRFVVTALALIALSPAAQAMPLGDVQPNLVRLPNGRQLAIHCAGTGAPTVVLDGGLGLDTTIWAKVQPVLARTNRTCAIDRAGYGQSDPGPHPRDAAHIVLDLKASLHASHVRGPYVVVGHSMGGYDMRLFASLYPRDVVGMVLVDPSIDGNEVRLRAVSPTFVRAQAEMDAVVGKCIRATAAGEMKPGQPLYTACGSPPVGSPMANPIMAQTVLSEQASLDDSSRQVLMHETGYGAMPLIVLTAGAQYAEGSAYAPGLPWPSDERTALRKVWLDQHQAIADRSKRGMHRVVEGSPHLIQMANPEAVIAAIKDVIQTAR